ncbi:MAG: TonB family protein [Pseudomonadota bacterium]
MSLQAKATHLSIFLHMMFVLCILALGRQSVHEKPPFIISFAIAVDGPANTSPSPAMPVAQQSEARQSEKKEQPLPKEKRALMKPPAKKVEIEPPSPPKKTTPAIEVPKIVEKEATNPENSAPRATDGGTTDPLTTCVEATARSVQEPTKPSPQSGGRGTEPLSLQQLDAPLVVLKQTQPPYPRRARRLNIEGWIRIKFVVDEHGHVDQVTVLDAKPKGIFEQSVLQCVGEWRFQPGTIGGRVVKALLEQTITFKLES